MRAQSDIEEGAVTAVRRAIAAAVKAERARCVNLAREFHRERREGGDPEGADVIWDLIVAIKSP